MLAIKHLKLNSDKTIAMFDNRFNNINVYFKSPTGKPIRQETHRGSGWEILAEISKQNNMTNQQLCQDFQPSIFAEKVTFQWHDMALVLERNWS